MGRIPLRHSSTVVMLVMVALTLVVFVVGGRAEQNPGAARNALLDEPQVFTSRQQSFRVVPIKGLSQPWLFAFLPNGDMLVTERAGRLRVIRNGTVDPEPLAGMPAVATAVLKGLMDIELHPRFAENQL